MSLQEISITETLPPSDESENAALPGLQGLAVIALVSCSMLIYEILLTRISALRLFFHFGFLIISNCLLGIGASGTMISICQETFKRRPRFWISLFIGLYLASLGLAYIFLLSFYIPYNLSLLRFPDLIRFSVYNLVTALPFFFAGTVVGILLSFNAHRINTIYFADLAGAGVGCFLVPFLLGGLGAGGSTVLLLIIAMVGGLIALPLARKKAIVLAGAIIAVLGLLAMPKLDRWFPIPSKDMLDFTEDMRVEIERVPEYSKWGANCRVDLVDIPKESRFIFCRGFDRPAAALLPEEKLILQDGSSVTPIINFSDHPEALEVVDQSLYSAALQLKDRPSVLVIGPGGGVEMWAAKYHNARLIKGIELNGPIVDIHRRILPEYSRKLLEDPRVQLIHGEGRSALMRDSGKYDIIQMSFISTYTAMNSGAYVLAESYLYTREAFRNMYDHLEDGGVLELVWGTGSAETLRLLSTMYSVLNPQDAAAFPNSVMCFRSRHEIGILLKKGSFTEDEAAKMSAFARKIGVQPLYLPYRSYGNVLETFIRIPDKKDFIRECSTNISPITDDEPYFFFLSRWPNLLRLSHYKWQLYSAFPGNPLFILFQLGLSTFLSVGLIMAPLKAFSRKGIRQEGVKPALVYFACLGLGFITIEIAAMQKFTLFLGLPLYSITVTLFSILIFSGLGSLFSAKWFRAPDKKVWVVPLGLILSVGLLVLLYPVMMNSLIHLALPIRIGITVCLLAPIGLLLGVPFAYGIRLINRTNPALVPWAWAVNGCCTVVGAILTIILSMNLGFNLTLSLALLTYLVGFAAISRLPFTSPLAD